MTTYTCHNGHSFTAERNPYERGFVRCPDCQAEVWSSNFTDAERTQELADAEMMLAALRADKTLEQRLAGMTWDECVQYVKATQEATA